MFGLLLRGMTLRHFWLAAVKGNLADQTNRGELAIWCARHRATTLYSVGYLVGPGPWSSHSLQRRGSGAAHPFSPRHRSHAVTRVIATSDRYRRPVA